MRAVPGRGRRMYVLCVTALCVFLTSGRRPQPAADMDYTGVVQRLDAGFGEGSDEASDACCMHARAFAYARRQDEENGVRSLSQLSQLSEDTLKRMYDAVDLDFPFGDPDDINVDAHAVDSRNQAPASPAFVGDSSTLSAWDEDDIGSLSFGDDNRGRGAIGIAPIIAPVAEDGDLDTKFAKLLHERSVGKNRGVAEFASNHLVVLSEAAVKSLRLPCPSGRKAPFQAGLVTYFLFAEYFLARERVGAQIAPYGSFVAQLVAHLHLASGKEKRVPYSRDGKVTVVDLARLFDSICPFGGAVTHADVDALLVKMSCGDAQCRINFIKNVSFKAGHLLSLRAFELVQAELKSRSLPLKKAKTASAAAAGAVGVTQIATPSAVLVRLSLPGCEISDVCVMRKELTLHIYVGAHAATLKSRLRDRETWAAAVAALPAEDPRAEVSEFALLLQDNQDKPVACFRFTGRFEVKLNVKRDSLCKQPPGTNLMNGVLTITLPLVGGNERENELFFV